jgi:hypothetical protein
MISSNLAGIYAANELPSTLIALLAGPNEDEC